MNSWLNALMNAWHGMNDMTEGMKECRNGGITELMNEWNNEGMNEWMNEWMHEWMNDEWTDTWLNEWMI